MKYDPYYNQIVARLEGDIDPDSFEACAVAIARADGFAVVPVRGGNDGGMDGAVADSEGEPFPLVVTTSPDCIGNLTSNLNQYSSKNGTRHKLIFATSQSLTPLKQRNLYERAGELGFTLVQLYERSSVAAFLYRNPGWSQELLRLSGTPSALSPIPLKYRPLLSNRIIGRDEAYEWFQNTSGDRLLTGEPGSGKTALLYDLAEPNSALFAVNTNQSELANAIREQQPEIIIVDDAHVNPNFLDELMHLRIRMRASFDIVATCWIGDRSDIARTLQLPDTKIHTLKRLSRDQIVDVIAESGIKGINWLVREIVTQAEGLPGLAVTLTRLCLHGSSKQIHNATALTSTILRFYVRRLQNDVKDILAAFSIGGDAGMSKTIIGHELGLPLPELRRILAELAAGGVVAEAGHMTDLLKVRPAALRHALLKDVFFSGAAALPVETLNNLLKQSPNSIETARELIHSKTRGGNVPHYLIQRYLESLPTAWEIWSSYAWLGYDEANWVLNNFRGPITRISHATLTNIPKYAIPKLMSEAVDDDRLLHATPEHPIRKLRDWVHESYPGTEQALERRQVLFEAAKRWLLDTNAAKTGYKVMLLSMDPKFESHKTDPGSGNTLTMQSAYLTINELNELQLIWKQILQLTREIQAEEWQPFLETIREWVFPYRNHDEEVGETLRNLAGEMAVSLAEVAKEHPGVLHGLRDIIIPVMPQFEVEIASDIEILYPEENLQRDIKAAENQWQQDVQQLAIEWQNKPPEDIVRRLQEIEGEMSVLQRTYPRLTPFLAGLLADKTEDPLDFVDIILDSDIPQDILFPFLNKAVSNERSGWEQYTKRCLSKAQYRAIAVEIILITENPPPDLLHHAMEVIPEFLKRVEILYLRDKLTDQKILMLFDHPDGSVIETVTQAEWNYGERGLIRSFVRERWKNGVLNYLSDDYWLADIFSSEPELAYLWLKKQFADEEFAAYRFDRALPAAISSIDYEKQLDLLDYIPVRYGYHKVVALLVGNNIDIYEELLKRKALEPYHLAPLAEDITESWKAKSLSAYKSGYSAQEIISSTISPSGTVVMWSGRESERWKKWLKKFEALQQDNRRTIAKLGQVGSALTEEELEKSLKREHSEDVFGRE